MPARCTPPTPQVLELDQQEGLTTTTQDLALAHERTSGSLEPSSPRIGSRVGRFAAAVVQPFRREPSSPRSPDKGDAQGEQHAALDEPLSLLGPGWLLPAVLSAVAVGFLVGVARTRLA